jgi:PST family polysaccharide transporter
MSQDNITHRTLRGLFWTFSGTGLQYALRLLIVAILARLLVPEDFGLVAAASIVVSFSAILAQLGVGPAIVQRPQIETRHLRTGFTLSLLFGLLLAGVVILAAPLVARFFRMEGFLPVLRVMALVFPLSGVSVVAQSLLQRHLRFRWLAGIQVVSYVSGYGLVGIVMALLDFGVWALVAAYLVQVVVASVLALVVQPHPKRPQLERQALGELLHFGGGMTALLVANYIAFQGDNLVVGRWLGAEALGFYGHAYQMVVMPAVLFGQVLDRVLFPAMASVQDRQDRLAAAYRRGVALVALLALPTSLVLFILAPELIDVLLGPAWAAVIVPFRILCAGILFRTSYKLSDSLVRATGAVYRGAWRHGVYAALVLGGAWIGQHWGLAGVAFGVLGAIIVVFFLLAQLGLRLTSLSWGVFLAAHLPALLVAVVTGMVVEVVAVTMRGLGVGALLTLVAAVAAVLVAALLLLRVMPQSWWGQDGLWMLEMLLAFVPARLKSSPIARYLFGKSLAI